MVLTNRGNPSIIFTDLRRIGKGSFGEVFLGKDSRENPPRKVAIKKMGITPKNTKYLIAEISVQQNSKHPNIVEFIGSWLLDIELWVCYFVDFIIFFSFLFKLFCGKQKQGCDGVYGKWGSCNFDCGQS